MTTAAPAYPPMSACDELVGRPRYQVMRSQTMAPTSPEKMTASVTELMSIMPAPTVFATAVPNPNAATKLKKAAQIDRLSWREHPRRDHRRNGIRGVVESVDVVEDEGGGDDAEDDREFHGMVPPGGPGPEGAPRRLPAPSLAERGGAACYVRVTFTRRRAQLSGSRTTRGRPACPSRAARPRGWSGPTPTRCGRPRPSARPRAAAWRRRRRWRR